MNTIWLLQHHLLKSNTPVNCGIKLYSENFKNYKNVTNNWGNLIGSHRSLDNSNNINMCLGLKYFNYFKFVGFVNISKTRWRDVLLNKMSWKRSLRYTITVVNEHRILFNLTFRKFFAGNLKDYTLKTRWLVHSFFFFKSLFLFFRTNNLIQIFFLFYNVNSFFFNNLNFFLENYFYFFKKVKKKFLFFFSTDLISYKLSTFKKIKSVKKFKKKLYNRSNRNYINSILKSIRQ